MSSCKIHCLGLRMVPWYISFEGGRGKHHYYTTIILPVSDIRFHNTSFAIMLYWFAWACMISNVVLGVLGEDVKQIKQKPLAIWFYFKFLSACKFKFPKNPNPSPKLIKLRVLYKDSRFDSCS